MLTCYFRFLHQLDENVPSGNNLTDVRIWMHLHVDDTRVSGCLVVVVPVRLRSAHAELSGRAGKVGVVALLVELGVAVALEVLLTLHLARAAAVAAAGFAGEAVQLHQDERRCYHCRDAQQACEIGKC